MSEAPKPEYDERIDLLERRVQLLEDLLSSVAGELLSRLPAIESWDTEPEAPGRERGAERAGEAS
jgi:hypothetical protein